VIDYLSRARTCLVCGASEPSVEFYATNQTRCKVCVADKSAERIRTDRDGYVRYCKAYRESNRSREAQKSRDWRKQNPERSKAIKDKYRLAHPRESALSKAKWKASNRPKVAEYQRRRRALKIGAEAQNASWFYEFVASRRKIRCYWCRQPVAKKRRHVDHIIPLSRGGAHSIENLCCACSDCNLKKGARMPNEFSAQGLLL
jgi:5-methylcytosine-specific restriction endonuclease McrA